MMSFRTATRTELGQILDWAAVEGWNPGLDDAHAFHAADPEGFFVATDQSDLPLAAISVVNHSDQFAFLGLYIVRPEYRGQGIGLALWRHAVRHAGDRTIGLDGVAEQQQNYVASGFVHTGGTTRFSGDIVGRTDRGVRVTTQADIPALIAMEAKASGFAKRAYLKAWFSQSAHRTTLAIDGPEGIVGACTVRACHAGVKIGPLVADSTDIAHCLLRNAAQVFDGPVTLDVPATASSLFALCERQGLAPGFQTARMYCGPFQTPKHSNFAVTSLELG